MTSLTLKRKQQILDIYNKKLNLFLQCPFCDYDFTGIFDAYKKPSEAKCKSWEMIRKNQREYKGTAPLILSHNYFEFTAGFVYVMNGIKYFRYFTKEYIYDFELDTLITVSIGLNI